jgi:hypothetical protein
LFFGALESKISSHLSLSNNCTRQCNCISPIIEYIVFVRLCTGEK